MLTLEILDEIKRDVATFSDPGTPVEISASGVLSWTQSRRRKTVQLIRTSSGFPAVKTATRELAYQGFLASEDLADLRDLADSIRSTLQIPPSFIDAPAKQSSAEGSSSTPAHELIVRLTADPSSLPLMATRVLFVHGNAGIGKTSVLRYAARTQAERYLRGETTTLYLYLDAQGKGLQQLEDIMARALQDLRAKFTYHSVSALTRRNCVVPIVDGFDELIGPSSAREALSNLAQFLGTLACSGALITSSRSAFLDHKTLYERAAELAAAENLAYQIDPIEILPWSSDDVLKYCGLRAPGPAVIERVKGLLGSKISSIVSKPFFLSHVVDNLIAGQAVNVDDDLVTQVVEADLVRESAKLKDSRGKSLLTPAQHRLFCESVADEMWRQERPELDEETIRTLAEIAADEFRLAPKDAKTFIDRSIAHTLLVPLLGGHTDSRTFEHELFRFEFLAGRISKLLEGPTSEIQDFLVRAEVPLEATARLTNFVPQTGTFARATIDKLSSTTRTSLNSQFLSANAGAIAALLVRDRTDLAGLQFHGFYFRVSDFGACLLTAPSFRQCVLERADLTRARLIECSLDGSQLIACKLGKNTRLDGTVVPTGAFAGLIEAVENGSEREIYDPFEIMRILERCGASIPIGFANQAQSTSTPKIDLTEKLLRHARTHFYFSRNDPWVRNNLLADPNWIEVEALLRRHHLLADVKLAKSGQPESFLRLVVPPDLVLRARAVDGLSAQADSFWDELQR